jgi:polyphenol oxidase
VNGRAQRAAAMAFMPRWPAPANVRACVTQRAGGVSTGAYASLNLGAHVGDDPARVGENRRRLIEALALPGEPCWLEQVHGTVVVDLDAAPAPAARLGSVSGSVTAAAPSDGGQGEAQGTAQAVADSGAPPLAGWRAPPLADGAVTGRAGVVCAVLTADCLPVLLCQREGRRVGVAHAGWRGLAAGILPAAVAAMGVPPRELLAWMGPAIGPGRYEVGEEVRAAFLKGSDEAAGFEGNARGRWQADLYALARRSLGQAGVEEIHGGGFCTYSEADRFFSHRREAPCGRMATLIWLAG